MKSCASVRRNYVDYKERIFNDGNDWDHNIGDVVQDPVDCVSRDEFVLALNEMKTGQA